MLHKTTCKECGLQIWYGRVKCPTHCKVCKGLRCKCCLSAVCTGNREPANKEKPADQ